MLSFQKEQLIKEVSLTPIYNPFKNENIKIFVYDVNKSLISNLLNGQGGFTTNCNSRMTTSSLKIIKDELENKKYILISNQLILHPLMEKNTIEKIIIFYLMSYNIEYYTDFINHISKEDNFIANIIRKEFKIITKTKLNNDLLSECKKIIFDMSNDFLTEINEIINKLSKNSENKDTMEFVSYLTEFRTQFLLTKMLNETRIKLLFSDC